MPPLSYAMLNEVLQYPVIHDERIGIEHKNNVNQNTNIIDPNKNIYKNINGHKGFSIGSDILSRFNNINEFFTTNTLSTDDLLREQIFISKLILVLLVFIFILNLVQK